MNSLVLSQYSALVSFQHWAHIFFPASRGGFVPVGELADTLPGFEARGRAMSAQARHHFTTLH